MSDAQVYTPADAESMGDVKPKSIVAHLYADLEFNFIPVSGKHPPCEAWKRWQEERVDIETIRRWHTRDFICEDGIKHYRKGPEAVINWGIVCGRKPWSESSPGTVVVDSDNEEADKMVCSRCPPTPVAQTTPSGGRHRVYRHPGEGYIPIRKGTTIDGKEYKIDIRGDGGYIVAPGSLNAGGRYQWDQPWTPELLAACPVFDPSWLPDEKPTPAPSERKIEFVPPGEDQEEVGEEEMDARVGQCRRYLAACPGAKQGEGADDYAFNLAVKVVHGFLVPEETAVELLMEWGEKEDNLDDGGSYYPWTEKQITHKVRDALRADYTGSPGDKLRPGDGAETVRLAGRLDQLFESVTRANETPEERLARLRELKRKLDAEAERDDEETEDQPPEEGEPEPPAALRVEPLALPVIHPLKAEADAMAKRVMDEHNLMVQASRPKFLRRYSEMREYARTHPPRWVVPYWLELGKLHVFTGAPFSGKSTVVADIVAASMNNAQWCGMRLPTVPVILFDNENGERIVVKRIDRALEAYGGDGVVEEEFFPVDAGKRNKPVDPDFILELIDEYWASKGYQPPYPDDAPRGIVVIDTLRSAFAGDPNYEENSNDKMSALLHPMRKLAHRTGWAILMLHHENRGGQYAGAAAIMSNADLAWSWKSTKETMEGTLSMLGSTDEQKKPMDFDFDMSLQRNVWRDPAAKMERAVVAYQTGEEKQCLCVMGLLPVLTGEAAAVVAGQAPTFKKLMRMMSETEFKHLGTKRIRTIMKDERIGHGTVKENGKDVVIYWRKA